MNTPATTAAGPPGDGRVSRRALLLDAALTAVVFAYNLLVIPEHQRAGAPLFVALLVASVVLCGAHWWRRGRPLAAFAAQLAATLVPTVLGVGLVPAQLMGLFGLYALAVRRSWRTSLPAAVALAAIAVGASRPLLARGWLNIGDVGVLVLVVGWVWVWGTLARVRRAHLDTLRDRAERLERERETHARMVVAQEKARIAREMHDIVSHGLSTMVLLSDGAASTARTDPEQAVRAMTTVRDTGRSALAEMRRMLGVLRDDEPGSHAPQPGLAQVPDLIATSVGVGVPVALTTRGRARPLSEGVDLTAFRIIQEALTNVRRHGGDGVSAEVEVVHGDDELTIRVIDDGRGPAADASDGHGLVGMRERVAAYGGTLRTGPAAGGGFEVVAELPIEEAT